MQLVQVNPQIFWLGEQIAKKQRDREFFAALKEGVVEREQARVAAKATEWERFVAESNKRRAEVVATQAAKDAEAIRIKNKRLVARRRNAIKREAALKASPLVELLPPSHFPHDSWQIWNELIGMVKLTPDRTIWVKEMHIGHLLERGWKRAPNRGRDWLMVATS